MEEGAVRVAVDHFVAEPTRASTAESLFDALKGDGIHADGRGVERRCETAIACGGDAVRSALRDALQADKAGGDCPLTVAVLEVMELLASASVRVHDWLLATRPPSPPLIDSLAESLARWTKDGSTCVGVEKIQAAMDVFVTLVRTRRGRKAIIICSRAIFILLEAIPYLVRAATVDDELDADPASDSDEDGGAQDAGAALEVLLRVLTELWLDESGPEMGSLPRAAASSALRALRTLRPRSSAISIGNKREVSAMGCDWKLESDEARRALRCCVARLAMEVRFWDEEHGIRCSPGSRGLTGGDEGTRLLAWLLESSSSTSHASSASCSLDVFFQRHWETEPLHVRAEASDKFAWLGVGVDTVLHEFTLAQNCCPHLDATEQDALKALREQRHFNGSSEAGGHAGGDILALRCSQAWQTEAEHWRNPCGEPLTGPEVCRAFRDGFTIAVRGITARSAPVLELCAGVGRALGLFAGANIYLTPPGARGLAAHYDDHDVFVLQLVGSKRWHLRPPSRPDLTLPRLYQPREAVGSLSIPSAQQGSVREITLQKGDVLYLPRGWVHQAEAPLGVTDDDGASLHLSLGLEVEPLTDWAGAMHIALRQHVLRSANGHTYSTQKGYQTEKLSLLLAAEERLHRLIWRRAGEVPPLRAACPAAAHPDIATRIMSSTEYHHRGDNNLSGRCAALLRCHMRFTFTALSSTTDDEASDSKGCTEEGVSSAREAPFRTWLPLIRHPRAGASPLPEGGTAAGAVDGAVVTELAVLLLAECDCDGGGAVWEDVRREMGRVVGETRRTRELLHAAHCEVAELNI